MNLSLLLFQDVKMLVLIDFPICLLFRDLITFLPNICLSKVSKTFHVKVYFCHYAHAIHWIGAGSRMRSNVRNSMELVKVLLMLALMAPSSRGNEECKANCMLLNGHCPSLDGDLDPVLFNQGYSHLPDDDCMNSVRTCLHSCNGWAPWRLHRPR